MKKLLTIALMFICMVFEVSAMDKKITLEDTVKRVMKSTDSEDVLFNTHAAVYHLKADAKNYKSVKAALESSLKSGKEVKLLVDPFTMNIEDISK